MGIGNDLCTPISSSHFHRITNHPFTRWGRYPSIIRICIDLIHDRIFASRIRTRTVILLIVFTDPNVLYESIRTLYPSTWATNEKHDRSRATTEEIYGWIKLPSTTEDRCRHTKSGYMKRKCMTKHMITEFSVSLIYIFINAISVINAAITLWTTWLTSRRNYYNCKMMKNEMRTIDKKFIVKQ